MYTKIYKYFSSTKFLLIGRSLMLVLMLVSIAFGASADEHKLVEYKKNHYLIATKDDFIALTKTPTYWTNSNYVFHQVADIDLENTAIYPIGNETNPFKATYDGEGNQLSNVVINWDNWSAPDYAKLANNKYQYYFGVFGYVQGTDASLPAVLKNIRLDNVHIFRTSDATTDMYDGTKFDVKIGVLAAIVGQYSKIHDISITNSSITDGGEAHPTIVKAIMAAGVVGDLASAIGGSATLNYAGFVFKNVYADVDIDLNNTRKNDSQLTDHQYFVGGIVGRIRTPGSIDFFPDNTIYTGTLQAKYGSVSPTVDNARSADNATNARLVATYACEVVSKDNTLSKVLGDDYDSFVSTRKYFNYKAYNSADGQVHDVPADLPASGYFAFKTHTFMANAKNDNDGYLSPVINKPADPSQWAMVQGVNFGTSFDPVNTVSDRDEALNMLNNAVIDKLDDGSSQKYTWVWDETQNSFVFSSNDPISDWCRIIIDTDEVNNTYNARVVFVARDSNVDYPNTDAGEFQWYCSSSVSTDDWAIMPGATSRSIAANKTLFYRVTWTYKGSKIISDYIAPSRTVYVFNPDSNQEFNDMLDGAGVNKIDNADYPYAGDDANNGSTPQQAVLTMKRAIELLDEYGGVNTNRVVVMGYYVDNDYLASDFAFKSPADATLLYNKPITITGTDNATITNGTFCLSRKIKQNYCFFYLQAPLRFDNIDLLPRKYNPDTGIPHSLTENIYPDGVFFISNYFDLTFDENVRMVNFPVAPKKWGLPADIQTVPILTIVMGTEDSKVDQTANPIKYPSDLYPKKNKFYTEPGITYLNINSGCYGRIICCSRNMGSGYANANSHNISGSYEVPNRVRLNVNIKDDIDFSKGIESTRYGVNFKLNDDGLTYSYDEPNYSHNIGLVSGGQTDGSAYGDIVMDIYAGHIARIITSNISFGRTTGAVGSAEDVYPTDSFYGRSVLNIYGDINQLGDNVYSETTINEVFGGILGRISETNRDIRPYFYGRSEINMYGGYIGKYTGTRTDIDGLKKVEANIYGAGSGGVMGLGDAENHTSDPWIPYLVNGNIVYKPFSATDEMPKMTMSDGTVIDLNKTQCYVNIYGGIVFGSVYGAGYGYSNNIPFDTYYQKIPKDLGVLYGDSYVTVHSHPDFQQPTIYGNVYGGGAGSSEYAEAYEKLSTKPYPENPFLKVASMYGNTNVVLNAGIIGNPKNNTGGDVFGGSMGIAGYEDIAALYGNTNITVDGATIYGNIYGGCELANIRKHGDDSGNTNLVVNSGTIGNNIFGGSKGIDGSDFDPPIADSKALIAGDTHVTVNGGDFLAWPYIDLRAYVDPDNFSKPTGIDIVNNRDQYRTFNIYGGGYKNCDIEGTANLDVRSSLLWSEASFLDPDENPNSLADATIPAGTETVFHRHYMDITYRNFCVYGGGFGEKTNVLKTNVYVTIPRDRAHVQLPHGYTIDRFLDHQSFFDIAGGGYSGDVGYWATGAPSEQFDIASGTPVKNIDINEFRTIVKTKYPAYNDNQVHAEIVKLYDHYVGGECNVTIDDYTFARKVIGGGFYGSCRTTNTNVRCGSLRQVYGGSLLGYVHDRAYLQFGNRIEDFVRWNPELNGGAGAYVYSETGEYEPFKGDFENVENNYQEVYAMASSFAKELNDHIFITENIYGGNDVKGIIGTKRWESPESTPSNPIYGVDETDDGPLFCTDIDPSEEKGIVFNIYGGTFMGDIYSAGNGHYRGYFVPEWVRYDDGPARMYRNVISSVDPTKRKGAYRSRPMVGCVNVNLRGNSENDMINLHGNFFGGGRECTIGQFNTVLPLEDPRRLVAGGQLHVNFGGHVQIDGNVYMGAEGKFYADQQCLPKAIDLTNFDGSTTKKLAELGDAAYDHWYYDTDKDCYLPGYPAPDKVDGNFGMKGEHMLSSYMQNVQVQGDVELTFYRYLYQRDENTGYFKYITFADGSKNRIRKHWIPGEIALDQYDAPNVVMNSFFLGGLSGSMTNNNVMKYTYPPTDMYPGEEDWGCIYRVVLPEGVTVRDKVVMGSENATINVYRYNADYTDVVKVDDNGDPIDPVYTYEGGMITQHTFSFDLIAYNDKYKKSEHYVPDDFYTNSVYEEIRNSDTYNLSGDNVTIHRFDFSTSYIPNLTSEVTDNGRYSLALTNMLDENGNAVVDANGNAVMMAYIGPRDHRTKSYEDASDNDFAVVSKLTLACKFDQLAVKNAPDPSDHHYHYGGNVYGGCYNSGIVVGDVVMNIGSNLLGKHIDESMSDVFNDYASLKYNIGRVFGGGFGANTRVVGDTHVNLLRNFKGMNVFGGGMMGDVTGTAHVTYIGTEDQSYVFGAIYGGGLKGYVGTAGETVKATIVRLFSGNVERVYGGSCMGDLHGRAFVELCDRVTSDLDHLDYKRLNFDDWGSSRLIAGKVFGGNDIAGNINTLQGSLYDTYGGSVGTGSGSATGTSSTWRELTDDEVDEQFYDFTTGVYLHEIKNDAKTSPGSNSGYNGFPLIGDLYGGSNGDYGVHGAEDKYIAGVITIATGDSTKTTNIDITGMHVPHIDNSHVLIRGGSVINAYGGGDMADIKGVDKITVDYPNDAEYAKARAGFKTADELNRVWTVLHFSSDQQKDEVTHYDADEHPIFTYQICRLFGGNNNADMGIQPTWNLKSGNIGSLYSGSNFGKMTFYQPYQAAQPAIAADPSATPPVEAQDATPEIPEKGLTLTVNSYDLTINYVYGGGRVGDIEPAIPSGVTPGEDFYGATLNIEKGIIDHVYGGNDVSGYVSYGTNVNLRGAISGDVYCAGNGNYLYKYDREGLLDYSVPSRVRIIEDYAFRTEEYTGARYFYLPAKADYGFDISDPTSYNATDAQTIMAINSYRPNVERAKILIEGSEDNKVWVRGNVYCGGNSATVTRKSATAPYDVIFDIGSHVILNGVFLGSNGESLALGDMINNIEKLNAKSTGAELNIVADNDLTEAQLQNTLDHSAVDFKSSLYPSILDLYMRAVETTEKPNDFKFREGISDAYIGEFCVGGNRGSMMTDQKISLTFPASLTIFNHIIGGCKDADVTYNGVTHIGGLTKPLAGSETTKIDIKVKSRFRPLNLLFPDVNATPPISINNVVVDHDGKPWTSGDKYYMNQQCNVFGGCFTSGTTVGDIKLDIYSDMLNYDAAEKIDADPTDPSKGKVDNPEFIDKQAVINGIKDSRSWRSFTVVGGGYGAKTAVYGNIDVRMLPENVAGVVTHPSAASIFGGSQEGLIVGNTNVEIRDGKVLANVYGASEAAKMYGSTSVIVGYPKYYRVKKAGNYRLNRVDYMSTVSREDLKDEFNEVVVPKTIAYYKGEIVPQNIYDIINGRVKNARIKNVIDKDYFRVGKNVEDKYVDKITYDSTATVDDPDSDLSSGDENSLPKTFYIGDLFEPVTSTKLNASNKPIADHIVPQDFDVSWDDITIWIGDQGSNLNPDATYYGQGNIYGGGYVPNTTDRTLIGQPTVMRFTKDYNLGRVDEFLTESDAMQDMAIALYGGNTAVMIWDDERNGEVKADGTYKYTESEISDHIHIGAGYFKEVTLVPGASVKGYFERVEKAVPNGTGGTTTEAAYVFLTSGKAVAGKRYYEKEADGGVYGGGRKVFAQAFRSVDIAYYGYAEHTPQQPKLLNTIQRADLATITDCCMELVGASDFTVNDYKGIFYAINRVGELRMVSSLNPNYALDEGYTDAVIGDGIRIHAKKRSRNYIALYNKTNHLGAFRSNWTFEQKYHLADGSVTTKADTDATNGYPKDGVESYVNHKHRFIEFYNDYAALRDKAEKAEANKQPAPFTKDDVDAVIATYEAFTGKTHSYTNPNPTAEIDLYDYLEAIGQKMRDEFAKRNVGTSGNMIGISSGYELSFEGLACQRDEGYETKYYGPAYGVTEMKLLTTVSGMGGGYVYALNHHYDPAVDDYSDGRETPGWCSVWRQDFLQTSCNFVFPGAAYHISDEKGDKHNYIIDDCFDFFDINHGYYQCDYHERDIIRSRDASDPEKNINDPHEVHYWYVSGNTYVFNVTLTAITSDSEKTFYLGNDNDRVNLFNVKKDTEITVSEVNWFMHNDIPAGSCDITNMDKKYKLYLSLSNDPKNQLEENSTDKNGAYVIRLPRYTYQVGYDSEQGKVVNSIVDGNQNDNFDVLADADGHKYIDPNYYINAEVNNNRFGYDNNGNAVADIKPRLGLRLVDAEFNRYADMGKEWSTRYYENHLKPDHMLQVVLETKNPGKTESIFFVINIDIKYLMGPAVYGNIDIENCALPGEYIYVNADDIEVVMDENLGVAEQKWRLYPNKADGSRYDNPDYKSDYTEALYPSLDPEIATSTKLFYKLNTPEFTVAESEKLIHIPAYYYQNGWEPVFAITANGENFECSLPFYKKKSVIDPTDESKTILVDDLSQPIPENRLQIHNYHRMKPMYNGSVMDLRLVDGARVYIEDEADMNYFFTYLDNMQTDAVSTAYTRFTTPDGRVTNPKYCKGLDFYQQINLHVPTTAEFTQTNSELRFAGNYHGNGNWMQIPSAANIYMVNDGFMYNTGFISEVANDNTIIYNENDNGTIMNCFYFNKQGKGALAKNGKLFNCYQNTPLIDPSAFKYNELMQLSTQGFRYGQAAYNLNGFYLQKRHKLLHDAYVMDAGVKKYAENNPYSLHNMDVALRGDQTISYDDYLKLYAVPYIEKMFNNGDYRYAFYSQTLNGTIYSQFTEALRTSDQPNYLDRMDNRATGKPVSMHDYTHKVDDTRWCDAHNMYHPLYDKDYMFFGEDLTVDVDDHNEHLPEAYHPENRVYRVGGFYGSAADKGYFMNRKAYLDTPLITAIDFVGYRDRDMYNADGSLKGNGADYDYRKDIEDDGWVIRKLANGQGWHEVFMAPTLDLPWIVNETTTVDPTDPNITTTTVDLKHDFEYFDINSDKVTHNLLVYTEDIPEAIAVMDAFHYSPEMTYGQTDEYSFATHSDAAIRAHHIIDRGVGTTPVMYGDYFHLVDKHDFNAPVAFNAKQAWYNRQPTQYSGEYTQDNGAGVQVYKTAWEGICLPFDVHKVYAASTDKTTMRDMGELTHFYGDDWKGHEYWLRRFVGMSKAVPGEMLFERPTVANLGKDANGNDNREAVGTYTYSNTAIYDLYKDFNYDQSNVSPTINGTDTTWYSHDQLYHYANNAPLKSRTLENYRYLSRSIPYIVTYPGEYFYEFDLSGKFYASKVLKYKNTVMTPVQQTICYLAKAENTDSYITIPVTDDVPLITYTDGGFTMKGTFVHVTDNAALSESVLYDKVENLAVLDALDLAGKEVHHGTEFQAHKGNMVVEPFHTYVLGSSPLHAPVSIGSRDGYIIKEIVDDDAPDAPDAPDSADERVKVWVEGEKLVISTPYDLETNIYNMEGQLVRRIRAYEGINRYSGLLPGFYIVLRTKFAIL